MAEVSRAPKSAEEMPPGSMLVTYILFSDGFNSISDDDVPLIEEKLDKMGEIHTSWIRKPVTATFCFTPSTAVYRERMMKSFSQRIGTKHYTRQAQDPAKFFGRTKKPATRQETTPEPSPQPRKKQKASTPQIPNATEQNTQSDQQQQPTNSTTFLSKTDPVNKEASQDQPNKETGNQKESNMADPPPRIAEKQTPEATGFRPRRHPASYQPATVSSKQPVSCLLFRPLAGASLHDNRIGIAKALNQLDPKPVAVRRIQDGGLAVDFSPDQPLTNILSVSSLADVPVTVAPPRRRPGSSGVIRGDFAAAEEVYELYTIHAENPALTKVEQLGSQPVYRLYFESAMPNTVRLFFSSYRVEPFFQSPLRCYRCSGFGHLAANCKRPACCSLCAAPEHGHKECPKQLVRCANCGGPHPATHKTCPHRLFHLQAAKTAAKDGIPIQSARIQAAATYAEVAGKKARPPAAKPEPAEPRAKPKDAKNPVLQLLTAALTDSLPKTS